MFAQDLCLESFYLQMSANSIILYIKAVPFLRLASVRFPPAQHCNGNVMTPKEGFVYSELY